MASANNNPRGNISGVFTGRASVSGAKVVFHNSKCVLSVVSKSALKNLCPIFILSLVGK